VIAKVKANIGQFTACLLQPPPTSATPPLKNYAEEIVPGIYDAS